MNPVNFANLPPELAFQVLLDLPYADLIRACRVNQLLHSICQDDYFWQAKTSRDYPEHPDPSEFPEWSWRELYDHLRRGDLRHLPIYFFVRGNEGNGPFDYVWVYPGYTYGQLFQIAQDLFEKTYPDELQPNGRLILIITWGTFPHLDFRDIEDSADPHPLGDVRRLQGLILRLRSSPRCPACQSLNSLFLDRQIRRADEVPEIVAQCRDCQLQWRG